MNAILMNVDHSIQFGEDEEPKEPREFEPEESYENIVERSWQDYLGD
jgi:hypothetical protein